MPVSDSSDVPPLDSFGKALVFDSRDEHQQKAASQLEARVRIVGWDLASTGKQHVRLVATTGEPLDQRRIRSLALQERAIQTLISALSLAQSGAYPDVVALLRVALERTCASVHIALDEQAWDRYSGPSGFKSSRSIGYCKEHFPVVGRLYGALSTFGVHVDSTSDGVRQTATGTWDVSLGLHEFNLHECSHAMSLVGVVVSWLVRAFELVFCADPSHASGTTVLRGSSTDIELVGAQLMQDRLEDLEDHGTK